MEMVTQVAEKHRNGNQRRHRERQEEHQDGRQLGWEEHGNRHHQRHSPSTDQQILNSFFKLWIKGANPRLEYLQILKTTEIDYNSRAVVEGIAHQRAPDTLTRIFKYYQGE
ncbi:unnamed protein product [Caenorhabditis brenneri]